MKKYETPKIIIVKFESTDIIQTSGPEPQTLNTQGINVGTAIATNIFE